MPLSRRDFVRLAAGTGAIAAAGDAGAAIAGPAPYRATVGVFLYGGNDGWNMAIPTDARHAAYLEARGSVGLEKSSLTALTGSAFALHPALDALRPLWDEGALALVLNTVPERSAANHWEAQQAWPRLAPQPRSAALAPQAIDCHFADPLTGAPLETPLANQLRRVARAIAERDERAGAAQFFVSQGGYDTHAGQVAEDRAAGAHADLLRDLAGALAGFHRTMQALGLGDCVTACTMSDFGRSWRGNAARGTDHGRGNSQLVVGGGLLPRRVHGAYPLPGSDAREIGQHGYLAAVRREAAALRLFGA